MELEATIWATTKADKVKRYSFICVSCRFLSRLVGDARASQCFLWDNEGSYGSVYNT